MQKGEGYECHLLALEEVSAKVRSGPPLDDADDYALPVWAGVVPLRLQMGEAQADERNLPDAGKLDMARFQQTSR